jgi:hypothetical protein
MIEARPGAVFEATYDAGLSGLAGTLAVAINDNQNVIWYGPTTLHIVELAVGGQPTGSYGGTLTAPVSEGQYTIQWSNDGSFDPGSGGQEDLLVTLTGAAPLPPPGAGLAAGPPCTAWVTVDEVVACCPDFALLTADAQNQFIAAATEVLYQMSNGQFPGECPMIDVRPPAQWCGCWTWWNPSYQDTIYWEPLRRRWVCGNRVVGCEPIDQIRLAGDPIRSIIEVKIDGIPLLPSEYSLMEPNRLVRMRDLANPEARQFWPSCQIMDLPPDHPGTFAVSYTYGADPPTAARLAAGDLACQMAIACAASSSEEAAEACELPGRVTRIVRAGLTIEAAQITATLLQQGATGIPSIDYFVASYCGETGQPPSVWSPDLPWPKRFSAAGGS